MNCLTIISTSTHAHTHIYIHTQVCIYPYAQHITKPSRILFLYKQNVCQLLRKTALTSR